LRDVFAAPALAPYRFVLLTPDVDSMPQYLQTGDYRGVDWVETPETAIGYVRAIAAATRRLRPAFVHSHGFISGALAGVACKLTRTRHLLTVHDVLLDAQFKGLSGRVSEFGLGASLAAPDLIHCVTRDSLDNLTQRYSWLRGLARKAAVIPHGVAVERITQAPRRDVRAELGRKPGAVVLGFLGRFMAQKGFRVLMDSIAQLKARGITADQLVVLAVGTGGFLREDRERIAALGLDEYFTFWPYQPDISSILKGIDALVMPSLWEASGLLAMEAMVAGTPVIGTSCIGLRETLADSPSQRLPPGDVPALTSAIEKFLQQPDATAARAFQPEAADRFDANHAFQKLGGLYERMIAM
jgi:glycosyltransferase involved in cell wall biosynthesis